MLAPPVNSGINVLVVEDNPVDVRLIKLALKQGGFTKEPTVVDDGAPALALLRRDPDYAQYPFPDLVILDLNLKRVDGPEVLAYIRQTSELSNLFVAILSSSPTDVMFSRAAQADCYLRKANNLDDFMSLGERIMSYYHRNSPAAN